MIDNNNNFKNNFESLIGKHEVNTVFNDFLDFSMDQFILNDGFIYFNPDKYLDKEINVFCDMFFAWIKNMDTALNNQGLKWYDFLGDFYQDIVLSKYKAGNRGQFFTPHDVCDLMTTLNLINDDKPSIKFKSCNDPTCGSGRLLLSHHVKRPYDFCVGSDVDLIACKMTCLNFALHGVAGEVRHEDTLTLENYNIWRTSPLQIKIIKQ